MNNENNVSKNRRESILSRVAAWQFMAFVLLLCLVWGSEILDLPALFFNASPARLDLIRACTLTAAVIFCAIVAVGNTYVQQKHILKGILILCSSCNKVKISKGPWEQLDEYLEEKTLATLAREICPDCFQTMEREITDANLEKWKSDARRSDEQRRLHPAATGTNV